MEFGTDASIAAPAVERHLPVERYLVELDERIASLALALGLSPDDPRDIAAALHVAPGANAVRGIEARRELRGLLALRWQVLQRCFASFRGLRTMLLIDGAERRLASHGFRP